MVEDPGSKCLHYLGKSHGLPCVYELVHRCQYLIPIQLEDVCIFWRKLEICADIPDVHERDMDSEMHDLTSMLEKISTAPISKVREVRHLSKGVICLVLPKDPCPLLTNPPETAVTKGRRKTNSRKRDKFHLEYVSITDRKIGKSSGSGSGSGSSLGSGSSPSPRERGRPPRSGKGRDRGRNSCRSSLSSVVNLDAPSTPFQFNNAFPGFMYDFIQNWKNVVGDGNCGFRVVSNFLFGDENHWAEIRRRMSYDLHHHMNMYVQLFGLLEYVTELIRKMNWIEGLAPVDYWMDTPNHLYVIANTFNLCVILIARFGSTTVLPFYSNMDCTVGMLFIGFIAEQEHFTQLQLRDGCRLPLMQVQW
ncbi:hypothetical protein M9H77_07554 [Catharanthus roseus]|uniref:Uncharacterized protein n=1 Tax=Catharanthus roseus TaxID=4058 RepID=A0ACC0BVJ0_CATRO|nr:hypothetical protein M9H77_07554 [Catharanthus roseus]